MTSHESSHRGSIKLLPIEFLNEKACKASQHNNEIIYMKQPYYKNSQVTSYYSIAICHLVYTFVSNVSKVNILTFRQANEKLCGTPIDERHQYGLPTTSIVLT
ncbi:conserved hypothetical protein [Trichinella spiralis]|uniref:hypothetical protein n=1 Tax=Trichinella spiralis TaxID=6334 RepID=UPI0001EFEC01|nr:conserved hypothetical protein [Trichinella spiralis]